MKHLPLSQLYPGLIEPRHYTPRDLTRATYGAHTAAAAATLGQPLIPWQQFAADVAGEVDADGVLVYSVVVITVQRQAGKTTLDLANDIQNCLMGPNRRVWYTAQTGQHAGDKWLEMAELFEKSPIRGLATVRKSNGSQKLTFANGSTLRPHPPTADSLHSKQSDKNTIDEAWYFTSLQAAALKQAIVPTTTTRRKFTGQRPQLWVMSTEGTAESSFFNKLLEDLRAEIPGNTCFIDFGIDPNLEAPDLADDAAVDKYLEEVAARHPGYGYLFEMEDLRGWLFELGLGEFARAYGNRRTGATERIIPEQAWKNAATMTAIPDDARVCFAAAVGLDGADTAITATAVVNGVKITEVIDHREGTAHALARIKELHARNGAPFIIDAYGPASDLHDQVERAGVPLVPLNTTGVTAACSAVFSGVVPPPKAPEGWKPIWHYRPHTALDDAAELAAKRSVGDGAWVWGRRASIGSIAALEAATIGTYGVGHMPEVAGLQVF